MTLALTMWESWQREECKRGAKCRFEHTDAQTHRHTDAQTHTHTHTHTLTHTHTQHTHNEGGAKPKGMRSSGGTPAAAQPPRVAVKADARYQMPEIRPDRQAPLWQEL
eukprot:3387996-Amphidinium_carterae.1